MMAHDGIDGTAYYVCLSVSPSLLIELLQSTYNN